MKHTSPKHSTPPREEIARRAYLIWEGSGRPDGYALEHWLEAEAQVLRELLENATAAGLLMAMPALGKTRKKGSRYGLVLNVARS